MTDKNSGDSYVKILSALSNPQRLRILAVINKGQIYVSELARELQMSRPLLYMHLQKLEAAGLITGHHEVSEDGKALRYYRVNDFLEEISLERIVEAVKTLTIKEEIDKDWKG